LDAQNRFSPAPSIARDVPQPVCTKPVSAAFSDIRAIKCPDSASRGMEMLTFIFPNYRKNSQKPDEELYSNFKQTFTDVCAPTPAAKIQRGASLGDALMSQSLPPRLVYFGLFCHLHIYSTKNERAVFWPNRSHLADSASVGNPWKQKV
jgi:hypothetical protein